MDSIPSWSTVDRYLEDRLATSDSVLEGALERSARAGLPPIQVSPTQGKFLYLLARATAARTILEVGTLGGYSAIWLARALPPGGTLVTLERNPLHVAVARDNLARAELGSVVTVREGPALDSLTALAAEGGGPFDLVFIDADKPTTAEYFDRAVGLARPGGTIVVDNVVRGGGVADASSLDENVVGIRRFFDRLYADRRVSATALQTVGTKGHDGFVLAVVRTGP